MDDHDLLRTSAAAEFLHSSPQTIYHAVRVGKLPSKKISGMHLFAKPDLLAYRSGRWKTSFYRKSLKENELTVKDAGKILNVECHHVYHLIRTRVLSHRRTGPKEHQYVLDREEIEAYAKEEGARLV